MRTLLVLAALTACSTSDPPVEAPVPDPTQRQAPTAPELGEVSAIEVEILAADRRHTRRSEAIATVMATLADRSQWKLSGMPRCRPRLWARLVPPSGEGGATYLFCSAGGSGHIWLPDAGSYALSETASRALYDATSALELEHVGTVAPTDVTEHLDSVMLTATIAVAEGTPQGLRGVNLYTGQRLEPDARWEDGGPVTRSFPLQDGQAAELVSGLALAGFFQRAKTFHSPTSDAPRSDPPAGSTEGPPPRPTAPAGWVQITVTTTDWHRTWHEHNATAIFEHTVHAAKKTGVSDDAAQALDQLASQLK